MFCSLQYRNPRRFLHSCRPAWPSPVPTAVTSASSTAITTTTTTTTRRLPVQPSPSKPERYYSSSAICRRPSVETASFAEHANSEELSNSLRVLLAEKEWVLDDEGTGVSKTYWFKTYTKCLVCFLFFFFSLPSSFSLVLYLWTDCGLIRNPCQDFTQVVGIRSKSKNHHPTITIVSAQWAPVYSWVLRINRKFKVTRRLIYLMPRKRNQVQSIYIGQRISRVASPKRILIWRSIVTSKPP